MRCELFTNAQEAVTSACGRLEREPAAAAKYFDVLIKEHDLEAEDA